MQRLAPRWLGRILGALTFLLLAPLALGQETSVEERLDALLELLEPPSVAELVELLGPVQELDALLEPMDAGFVPLLKRPLPEELSQRIAELTAEQDELEGQAAIATAQELVRLLDVELGADHPRTSAAAARAGEMRAMAELPANDRTAIDDARKSLKAVVPLYREGRLEEALGVLVEQVALEYELLGINATLASSLGSIATLLHAQGDYPRAERTARASLQRACFEHGTRDANVAVSLNNLASLATILRHLDEAETLHAHSLALRRELYGDRAPEFAQALLQLAGLYRLRGDIPRASQVVDRAIAILEETGVLPDRLGVLLLERGVLDWSAGHDELAREDLQRAIDVLTRAHAGDHPELVKATGTLADVERGLGNFARAMELAQQSSEMIERLHPAEHPQKAQARHRLALCLEVMGELDRAEQAFRSAIIAMDADATRASDDLTSALVGLAALLSRKGDLQGAREFSDRALIEQRRTLGQTRMLANALANMARRKQAAGDFDGALEAFDEALGIFHEQLDPGHARIAGAEVALASLLFEMGEPESAWELVQGVLASTDHGQGAARKVAGDAHQLAGRLALEARELESAREHADQALELRRELLSAPHAALVEALVLQARIARASGQLDDARTAYGLALEQAGSLRTRIVGDERARARYAGQLSLGSIARSLALVHLEQGQPSAAFEAAEAGRERALLDLLQRSGTDLVAAARASNASNATLLEERLESNAQASQALLFAEQTLRNAANRMGTTEAEWIDLEERVLAARRARTSAESALEASLREVWPSAQPLPAKSIAAKLAPDEALLHFTMDGSGAGVLALRGGPNGGWLGHTVAADGSESSTLQTALVSMIEAIRKGDPVDAAQQLALSNRLLPPAIWKHLAGCKRVIVVPDGALHELPFDCLLTPDGPWLEHGPRLVYSSSAALFARSREARANSTATVRRAVVLGNPSFATSTPTAAPDEDVERPTRSTLDRVRLFGGQLAPLPGSGIEARQIAATLGDAQWKVETLIGAQARSARLLELASGATLVHLATHGLAAQAARPYESALALAAPTTVSETDDGFLTLDDLVRHWGGRLRGCDLVVLSACDTQVGVPLGESRVALSWGFFFAGADSVLVSLWKVDDRATTLLMERFYANYSGNFTDARVLGGERFEPGQALTEAAALQEAKAWLARCTPEQNRARLKELGFEEVASSARGQFPRPGAEPTSQATIDAFDFRAPRFGSAFVLYGQPN